MYAIVALQGHQYIVQEGLELIVDKINEEKKQITIEEVLAVFDETGKEVKIGTPYLKAKVTAEIVENKKGEKIRVFKFHRKNRYQRVQGFRPHQTVLKIKKITLDG